ncbi:protein FAM124A [Sardina pilchardus]|uniref:protein FAM124A n=1 Tax=Sardina pilchardus TaxID=27697 RepID=UPI002E131E66
MENAQLDSGHSDYRYMSSESNEDPFRVCVHVLCEAGEAEFLQAAADQLLCVVQSQPELRLLRVSERGPYKPRPLHSQSQPALALILFLREDRVPSLQRLHSNLRRPPWRYHHTESVGGHGVVSAVTAASQDFYTLAPGTPLWALRQVHYGKEVVRFTVYCRYHSYGHMVRLYALLLGQRRVVQRKEDFCFSVVYSSTHTEVQLSLKRLPRGQLPVATESALLEFRVPDVGGLIPLLPRPCTPISSLRWQTHDYDNNKILLQVQPVKVRRRHTLAQIRSHHQPVGPSPNPSSPPIGCSPPASSDTPPRPPYGRGPASYRNRRYHRNSSSRSRTQTLPPARPRPQSQNPLREPAVFGEQWAGRRAHSFSGGVACPPFRLNVAALVGAVETDVDTGRRLSGTGLDLSVVSAYSQLRPQTTSSQSEGPSQSALQGNVSLTTTACHQPQKPLDDDGLVTWSSDLDTHTLNTPAHTHSHTHRHDASEEEEEQEFYI